jgi:hypothetical protein
MGKTRLEELVSNARKALDGDNALWPPSPQAVLDALSDVPADVNPLADRMDTAGPAWNAGFVAGATWAQKKLRLEKEVV